MSKTVGLQLRQARQERGLTIEEVSQATRIRAHHLRFLEAGEFSALPSKAQARGFLRSYADFLELDASKLLADTDTQNSNFVQQPVSAESSEKHDENSAHRPGRQEKVVKTAQTIIINKSSTGPAPLISEESQAYFIQIGSRLQKQRELLGLTFDEVEHHTRLRKRYLQALELGEIDALPSTVQGRGMLNNYAVFLGLDPDPLLLLYAEGLQDQLALRRSAEQKSRTKSRQRKPGRKSISIPVDLLLGGLIGLIMVAFVVWGGLRILSARSQDQVVEPSAPSIAEVLLASPTASASPTSAPATALPPPTLTLASGVIITDAASGEILTDSTLGNVMLQLIIQQRTWLRVIVDGQIEYQGRVVPGSALSFSGDTAIEILTGNGEAFRVLYNEQDFGVPGDYGEVVDLIFTAEGVLEPTPTITLTPAPTSPFPALPSPTSILVPALGTTTPISGTPELP